MRWLDKLSKMDITRYPRRFLNAWTNKPRKIGRPQKTTKHAISKTLQNLGIPTLMNTWMELARRINGGWGNLVEWKLGLVSGTYVPFKSRIG